MVQREYEQYYEELDKGVNKYLKVKDDRSWMEWRTRPNLREHLYMATQCSKIGIQLMKDNDCTRNYQKLKNTKTKKPLDQMKLNQTCLKYWKEQLANFNKIIEEEMCDNWKTSNTICIDIKKTETSVS